MTIAINTCKFGVYTIDENYVRSLFLEFGKQKKGIQFILLVEVGVVVEKISKNITIIELPVVKSNTLYSWYKYQKDITVAIKKYRVNVFITPILFSKLFIKVPQLLLLPHAGPLLKPLDFNRTINTIFNKYVISSINKVEGIITSSIAWKEYLSGKYNIPGEKILDIQTVEGVKTENRISKQEVVEISSPYFLVWDEQINNEKLILVLKAFSAFKKRLRSTMKVAFIINDSLEMYSESIKAYKYKNDVVFIEKKGEDIVHEVISKSYAVILNSQFNGFMNIGELTYRMGSVLIMVNSIFKTEEKKIPEGLYYESGDIIGLSAQMMEIYKNENLRGELLMRNEKNLSNIEQVNIYEKSATFFEEIKFGGNSGKKNLKV